MTYRDWQETCRELLTPFVGANTLAPGGIVQLLGDLYPGRPDDVCRSL